METMREPAKLPYATADMAGCGGEMRISPADFLVEELPAYLPSGSGEHLYLWVEKRGISTSNLRSILCRQFGLSPRQIGHAGLKDSQAVTRQWLSIHTATDLPLQQIENERISVLQVDRHCNKLRPGHLNGNKFEILVRGTVTPTDFDTLLQRLQVHGFPNYFGEQRFGVNHDNHLRGKALLRSAGRPRMGKEKARFLINAYQSSLFNRVVSRRLAETGSLRSMLAGDLSIFHASASFFPVREEDLEDLQHRANGGEISPSAPMVGHKTPFAQGVPGAWEMELLREEGIAPEDFKTGGKRHGYAGERRAVRAFAQGLDWSEADTDGLSCLRFSFSLKPGVYATSFLREVMKNGAPVPEVRGPCHHPYSGLENAT